MNVLPSQSFSVIISLQPELLESHVSLEMAVSFDPGHKDMLRKVDLKCEIRPRRQFNHSSTSKSLPL